MANFAGASHTKGQQYWFDKNLSSRLRPNYFSNRPFSGRTLRRHSMHAPADERFIRVDMEFTDHSRVPTPAELKELADWATESGAIGMLDTVHGAHVYFLTDKAFPWANAKQIIERTIKNYSGQMQVCKASYAITNWSKTHKQALRFFQPKNRITITNNDLYIYCEPNNSVGCPKNEARQSKGKTGSEAHKRGEFSAILGRVIRGEDLKNIPMLYHKPEVLARTFERPEYAWVKTTRIKSSISFVGVNSHSRPIQRDFSFFGHLRHSLADLTYSNYTVAGCLKVFCTSQYDAIRAQLISRVGEEKWMGIVQDNIEQMREKYAGKVGLYTVSPALLKQAFELLRNRRNVDANALQQWFKKKNQQRNIHHTARGTSISTAKRTVSILKSCGIISQDGIVLSKGSKTLLNQCIASAKKYDAPAEVTEEKAFTQTKGVESPQTAVTEAIEKKAITPSIGQTFRPIVCLSSSAKKVFIREPEVCGVSGADGYGSASYEGSEWKPPE